MSEYRLTFGSQYGAASFGADPHPVGGYTFVHRDGWWTIVAPDYNAAHALAVAMLGVRWSNLYDAAGFVESSFPRGELLRLVHPASATEVVHLLTGTMPPYAHCTDEGDHTVGGQLLVTVWGNGAGEVAWRESEDTRVGWGIPAELTPAP